MLFFSAVDNLQVRNAAVSLERSNLRTCRPVPGHRAIGMGMLFNRHTVIARRQRRGYNTAHVAIHTQAAADANYVPGRPSPPLRVSGTFPVRTRVVSACHQTAIP